MGGKPKKNRNNMAQKTEEELEQYRQKLIQKFKKDPKWELQQEFGRMLMRHIDSFTNGGGLVMGFKFNKRNVISFGMHYLIKRDEALKYTEQYYTQTYGK